MGTQQIYKDKKIIETIPDYFPAAVSEDLYKTVQMKMDSKTSSNSGGRKGNTVNIFANLTKCAYCGNTMCLRSSVSRGKRYNYLSCYTARFVDKTKCTSTMWKLEDLEHELLTGRIQNPSATPRY